MGWTYEQYLDAPLWFVNELVNQLNKETRDMEKSTTKHYHRGD